ncbi:hypothetical protein RGR602_CH03321 [Rhizobium gallicum bv. gallicum R602sp]|uniref:Uncharacterized protein n=1 Tax=Rhizobium gallicum bv. gallicum R602sp TaxID=1041138 RepID=A0A0B4X7C0_9HYPH|nr:hypothetical protein RGR602_CH03321 [Rhizobium gallicum bv. gallicum R602sp]
MFCQWPCEQPLAVFAQAHVKFTTVPGEEFTPKLRALMIIKAFHDSEITPAIKRGVQST